MFMYYDFSCTDCNRISEAFTNTTETSIECPHCSGIAGRILSPVRIDKSRIACSGDSASPESIRHFDRVHRQRKALEEKTFKEHGDYGKAAGSD